MVGIELANSSNRGIFRVLNIVIQNDTFLVGRVGWVGGWLEKVKIKLNSTQIVVKVEVRVELGNNKYPGRRTFYLSVMNLVMSASLTSNIV